jgi:hypothetical protein
MLHRALDGEAVIVAQLVEPHDVAAEHGREGAGADGVASLRREAGRVVGRVQDRPVLHVLGEDGERAPVVVEAGHDQPIVGHEPLELGGEVGEELLRIEDFLHGAPDGGEAGHQIGENDVGLVRGAHRPTIPLIVARHFRPRGAGPTV